jgi:TnsA endonuclease N terminal
MDYMDKNPDYLQWSSEEIIIPYISPIDGRWHRYFPDFLTKVKSKTGIKTFLIEVKPHKQSMPPKPQKRVTKKYINEVATWGVNRAKWKAAIEYCKDRKWEFIVMTSDDGDHFRYLNESDLLLT